MIFLCEQIWKRCPVFLLFIPYFWISRNRRIVLWYCEIGSWYHSSVLWMLYVKARFPINEISCLKTLLYWSEITSIGIHHIQCRSSFDSWFFSSYMMLENIHTKVQHFDFKQKINQWILKFFIIGSHFAKDPVSVWAFDYKQLVFETGFENRIQFRCNQTRPKTVNSKIVLFILRGNYKNVWLPISTNLKAVWNFTIP